MVRLRSDRWYSRSGQRQSRLRQRPVGGGLRRVSSLAILLVLVVWTMQRSSDPVAYERIFSYLGVPFDKAKSPSSEDRNLGGRAFSGLEESARLISPEASAPASIHSVWDQLPWTDQDLSRAAMLAFAQRVGVGIQKGPAQDSSAGLAPNVEAMSWSQPDIELAVQMAMAENAEEFSRWLDARLIAQLTDGSPWRGSEADAFYRLLQRTSQWDRTNADQLLVASYPAIKESIPLHRGKKWIRCRGWIEQAKRIQPKEPKFGIDEYWTLWLRPSDQTTRPIVVYVTRLPPLLEGKSADKLQGEIEVFGLPAKLMAYNALRGVEVAPTLCGVASDYFVSATSSPSIENDASGSRYAWVWPVVIAGLVSVICVTWIWRRSQWVDSSGENDSSHGSKKLQFKLGKAKSGSESHKKLSLLFLVLSLVGSGSATNAAQTPSESVQEEASKATDEGLVKTQQLLASRLDEAALFEMRHYAANELGGLNLFPNSMGRLMFTLGQLGDERLKLLHGKQMEKPHWRVSGWQGWVVACDVIPLQEEQIEWMTQQQVYRLTVEVLLDQGKRQRGVLFIRQAPTQWLNQTELRQPFQATVVDISDTQMRKVLGVDSDKPGEPEKGTNVQPALSSTIGIASNIQWVFEEEKDLASIRPKLSDAWLNLALLGSDLTWIDLARSRQKYDLGFEDRSSFYSLLRIARELSAIERSPTNELDWAKIHGTELLAQEQDQWVGRTISVKGRIARISRVAIDHLQSQELTKAKFYYELDGFIRIEGKRIVIPPPKSRSGGTSLAPQRDEELVYENEFPMTVVALELPDFLKIGEVDERGVTHQSWATQTWVDVKGVFYRNWSYRSDFVSRGSSRERQMAPLVVASSIRMTDVPVEKVSSPGIWVNWLALFMIGALLALIWGFVVGDIKNNSKKRRKKNMDQHSR